MAKSFRSIVGLEPAKVDIKDSVLVIIDAQNEYATGLLKIHQVESSRAAISTLLTRFRHASSPVIHIVHAVPNGAPVFTPETPLAAEFAELAPRAGEAVLAKQQPGAFTGTELDAAIKRSGKATVVLVGYMAHVCVSTTARQASERGYETVVVSDAVGDRDVPGVDAEELKRVSLAEVADAFGTVVESKDIVG